jgi:hypothetical protein
MVALWSIHERLAGKEGTDLPPPDEGWLEDLALFRMHDRKEASK